MKGCSYVPCGFYVAKRTLEDKFSSSETEANECALRKDIQTQECVRGLMDVFNELCRQSNVARPYLSMVPVYLMDMVHNQSR